MDEDQLELVRTVAEDLRHLQEDWGRTVGEDRLRRDSTTLRRLLLYGDLQRAWKALGFPKEPQIKTFTLDHALEDQPVEKIWLAAAGGARREFGSVQGVVLSGGASTPDEMKKRAARGPSMRLMGLTEFRDARCLVINGRAIPRRLVVTYVANKLGGAHFDPQRAGKADEMLFRRLDAVTKQHQIMDQNPVYSELLAAGQAIADAEDVKRLLARANEVLS